MPVITLPWNLLVVAGRNREKGLGEEKERWKKEEKEEEEEVEEEEE